MEGSPKPRTDHEQKTIGLVVVLHETKKDKQIKNILVSTNRTFKFPLICRPPKTHGNIKKVTVIVKNGKSATI